MFVIWNRLDFVWPGSKYFGIFWTSFWHPPDILWMFFHQKKQCWCCYCFSAVTAPLFECSRFPGIIYLHNSTIGLNHCDFCPCRYIWTSSRHHPAIHFFHWKKLCRCCCCFSTVTVPLCECSRFPGIIYLHNSTLGLNHCDFCSCWCMHYYTSPIPPLEILWTPLDALRTSSGYPLDILWTSSGHPLDIFWTSSGHSLDILLISSVHSLYILWTSSGHLLDMLWTSSWWLFLML